MDRVARCSLPTATVALCLGVTGDVLLRGNDLRLGVWAWTILFVAAGFGLRWRYGGGFAPVDAAFGALGVGLLGAGWAWRDSGGLRALDTLLATVLLAVTAFGSGRLLERYRSLNAALGCVARAAMNAVGGGLPLVYCEIPWRRATERGWLREAAAVGRGLLIATPLVALFCLLLMSADVVFERWMHRVFRIDVDAVGDHLGMIFACAWASAGLYRASIGAAHRAVLPVQDDVVPPEQGEPDRPIRGIVEAAMVIALVDLLFLAFVVVQVRYLFGGAGHVAAVAGLTYAQYARRGFFELVAVAALSLPVLLAAHAVLRRDTHVGRPLFRILAAVQVSTLYVILASAITRMRLYQVEYGQTELRYYTTAFMFWLAAVFAWFCVSVLRERRALFVPGATATLAAAIIALNIANPDARVAAANVAMAARGRAFDADYAARLSADAVPTLVASLPGLGAEARGRLQQSLAARWHAPSPDDWRDWNAARAAAVRAVRPLAQSAAVRAVRPLAQSVVPAPARTMRTAMVRTAQ